MSVTADRERAVAETISAIRTIEDQQGVTRESLDAIRTTLIELANRRELFNEEEFPPRDVDNSFLYTLSEDEDHRFTLYLNSSACHVETPPHNHTTWAVVVGILGNELNRFYRRVDDGSVAGKGEVEQVDTYNITAGTGVTLMPDDIHSIHQEGPSLNLHLHMYGRALTEQRERVQYDIDNGTYKVFPATPGVTK
jgi:predicted metal-dependent enzyme (double-stranded beta helix superfamily)